MLLIDSIVPRETIKNIYNFNIIANGSSVKCYERDSLRLSVGALKGLHTFYWMCDPILYHIHMVGIFLRR